MGHHVTTGQVFTAAASSTSSWVRPLEPEQTYELEVQAVVHTLTMPPVRQALAAQLLEPLAPTGRSPSAEHRQALPRHCSVRPAPGGTPVPDTQGGQVDDLHPFDGSQLGIDGHPSGHVDLRPAGRPL